MATKRILYFTAEDHYLYRSVGPALELEAKFTGDDLGITAFRTCLDDPATRARIGVDVEAGARAGVASTPTLFINGRAIEGALDRPYYDYALIIEQDRDAHHDARKS